MGIVFSGMFAAGLILYIAVKPDVHLDHILFGDMLGDNHRRYNPDGDYCWAGYTCY